MDTFSRLIVERNRGTTRFLASLILLVCVGFVFSGCGGKEKAEDAEPEPAEEASAEEPVQEESNRLGIVARELSADQRQQLGVDQGGVLVDTVKEGPAASAGITAGDIILMLEAFLEYAVA